MVMTGADAEELDRLAVELRSLGGRLGRTRSSTGRALSSAPWHGRSADAFRQRWAGEYARSLQSAEQFLREAGDTLARNASEQRSASGARGSGVSGGGGGGSWGSRSNSLIRKIVELLGLPVDIAEHGVEALGVVTGIAALQIVKVAGYVTRNGTVVDDYFRWAPRQAERMTRLFGQAKDVMRVAKHVDKIGKGLIVLGGVIEAGKYYVDDSPRHPTDERIVRAAAVGAVHTGIGFGSVKAGAAVGAVVGGPVGLVVGAGVGVAVGVVGSWAFDRSGADDLVADLAQGAYRLHNEANRQAVEAGTSLIRGGTNLVQRGWGAVF
jgi:hypothetical protein